MKRPLVRDVKAIVNKVVGYRPVFHRDGYVFVLLKSDFGEVMGINKELNLNGLKLLLDTPTRLYNSFYEFCVVKKED